MTLNDLLHKTQSQLKEAGIENWQQESFWILEEAGGFSRKRILIEGNSCLDLETEQKILEMVQARSAFYPLEYLLGHKEFFGISFQVSPAVLIPRPETEVLVLWAAHHLPENASVLEIGSGSGCICISLKKIRPDLKITAVDLSEEALRVSRKNAEQILGASQDILFFQSDLFQNQNLGMYQAILSNPPYLSESDLLSLQKELFYEPMLALSPGGDGYAIYRRLAEEGPSHLDFPAFMAVEIGIQMENRVIEIFEEASFSCRKQIPDQAGIIRSLVFQKKNH